MLYHCALLNKFNLALGRLSYLFDHLDPSRFSKWLHIKDQGPVVQSPISANPGLTLLVLLRVNPGLVLIGL